MTGEQCRAARRLLKWTQDRLARAAGVSQTYVSWFEINGVLPEPAHNDHGRLGDLRAALERAGVEFTDGEEPGVRLRRAGRRDIKART